MAVELDKEQIISLYEAGRLQKEVAKKLGVSVKTLSNFMKENGIETRKPTNYKKVSEEKITIINSVNVGYTPMKIEKKPIQRNDNALNLYLPEKWKWRD